MRVFVSYARVDKPYCIQIVDTLDVHDTWYDQRLYAGQNWWKEILRRLDWCEAFVYLMSPDSVASEYCRKEHELAVSLGKHVLPVLIREDTILPDSLRGVQYVDFTNGITPDSVKVLLNSIYLAERNKQPALPVAAIGSEKASPPITNPSNAISAAAHAMEQGMFDQAVFLLKQAKENGFTSRFINIDALLSEAEAALDKLAYLREAEREYRQIVELVRHSRTRRLGLEAFAAFSADYPGYDPDHIKDLLTQEASRPTPITVISQASPPRPQALQLPFFEWCTIPAGNVVVDEVGPELRMQQRRLAVPAFQITKYPITHAQFEVFCQDSQGYSSTHWWEHSPEAYNWRINNPEPKPGRFKGGERPREMVNWYDAAAFTAWLSDRLHLQMSLPTAAQWQRAARGDDNRVYPWGNTFDKNKCNTRESDLKMTSLVMRYSNGSSPFGVYDLAGNVWEWCVDAKQKSHPNSSPTPTTGIGAGSERAVFGGSFVSAYQRSQIAFHYFLDPLCYHATIGFRVVARIEEDNK